MSTESYRSTDPENPMFSKAMKEKIADQIYLEIIQHSTKNKALYAMIRAGFDGVYNMDDKELFRRASMYGLLDEDAGSNR